MKRRRFSSEFKVRVALEAIKGQRTAKELAYGYGIHINQITLWKKQLLKVTPQALSRRKDKEAERLKKEKGRPYRKVGQL